jgi:hypothetical protein
MSRGVKVVGGEEAEEEEEIEMEELEVVEAAALEEGAVIIIDLAKQSNGDLISRSPSQVVMIVCQNLISIRAVICVVMVCLG